MSLSDTVERWLPGQVPYGRQITVRQLLNHTSGVPNHHNVALLLEMYDDPASPARRPATRTPASSYSD
jgi:D-alanyl-D-alanine carboxypeptidase